MGMTRTVTTRLKLETSSLVRGAKRSTAAQRTARRRVIRYSLLGFNVLLLGTVGFFILQSANTPTRMASSSAVGALAKDDAIADPLDRLSSADIAVNVARVANLPQSVAVTNQADSENAQLSVVQSSDSLVAKPQVVATAFKSNKDIQAYTTKAGDTAASIGAQFHVTTDSIVWSNNLSGNNVTAGQKIYVLPYVNGIIYVVKDGDTPEKLAEKYSASKEKIIASNDAELTGLTVGTRIIIPDGKIAPAAPTRSSSGGSYAAGFPWGGGPLYGGNGYIRGYCTWYVANRIAVPSNWGNANTWDNLAPRSGWTVSSVPRPGAVAQTNRGSEGHVAYVEAVSEDGSMIKYSDMNGISGYNRVGYSDWTPISRFEHYIYQ